METIKDSISALIVWLKLTENMPRCLMMRNKTVSLCDKSYEVARKMPNFSEWLRFQLLKPMKTPEEDRKNAPEYVKPKPQKNYLCSICRMGGHYTHECKYQLEGQWWDASLIIMLPSTANTVTNKMRRYRSLPKKSVHCIEWLSSYARRCLNDEVLQLRN